MHAELVNGDAEETSTGSLDAGSGELLLCEAPAKADTAVVTRGWAVDERAEWTFSWAWGDARRTELAGVLAADFARWIIEEGLYTPLPVLTEVVIRDSVVLADHFKRPGQTVTNSGCRLFD